jgi:hypothetical protein
MEENRQRAESCFAHGRLAKCQPLVSEDEGQISRELLEDLKKSMASAKKAQLGSK